MSLDKIPCLTFDSLLEQFTRSLFRKTRNQSCLTIDLIRKLGLDSYLADPRHEAGMYCVTLLWRKWLKETGRTRSLTESNHGREIRTFDWTEKARSELK